MKFNQLRDVVAIAERGSLRAAAAGILRGPAGADPQRARPRASSAVPLFERAPRHGAEHADGRSLRAPRQGGAERGAPSARRGGAAARRHARQRRVGPFARRACRDAPSSAEGVPSALSQVQLHVIEGWYPTLEAGLKDGSVDFYVGPRHERRHPRAGPRAPIRQHAHHARTQRPSAFRKPAPADLVEAEWATTSITFKAEEELRELFEQHGLPTPRLALQSESALTLIGGGHFQTVICPANGAHSTMDNFSGRQPGPAQIAL